MSKGKNIITQLQREILVLFSSIPDSNHFFLAGGTALAEFYFKHRKSYDLDLFTSENGLIMPFSYTMEYHLVKKYNVINSRRFETFAEFEISNGDDATKIQLALDSPFRFEQPSVSDMGVNIISYKDVIADKTLAYFSRTASQRCGRSFFYFTKRNSL